MLVSVLILMDYLPKFNDMVVVRSSSTGFSPHSNGLLAEDGETTVIEEKNKLFQSSF